MRRVAFPRSRRAMGVFLLVGLILAAAAGCGGTSDSARIDALEEYQRGDQLREQGNLARAFQAYNAALRLDPRLAEAYAARGYVYYRYDNLSQALEDLSRAIQLDPDMALAHNYRGMVLAATGDFDNAVLDFTKAVQIDPSLSEAYFNRAKLYFDDGDFEGAIEDLSLRHGPGAAIRPAVFDARPRSPPCR